MVTGCELADVGAENKTQSSGRAVVTLNPPPPSHLSIINACHHPSIVFLPQMHEVDFPFFSRLSSYRVVFWVLKDYGFSQKTEPRTHPRHRAKQDQLPSVRAALTPALPARSYPRVSRASASEALTHRVFFPLEQSLCELGRLPRLALTSCLPSASAC